MSAAGGGVRFAPAEFRYNGRVAAALVPALAVAAALGGRLVMGVMTVGAMVWYLLDAMSLREGSLTVGWGTLFLANCALAFNVINLAYNRPVVLTILLLLLMGVLFMLAGMWLTLQFRWIQMQHPAVVLAFERQVLTASLPVAAVVQALGAAAVVDEGDVPYYLAAILCVLYAYMGRPLVSSFHAPRGARSIGGALAPPPREALVQSRVDAALMALTVSVLPGLSYIAIHWAVLGHWVHLWALLLLVSGPAAVLAVLPGGLWWLPGPPAVVKGAQRLLLFASALGVLAGFEGRVVFYAFTPYIKMTPPWSYVAVTAALLGLALLGVAHLTGILGTSLDVTLAGSCLMLCTTAGAVAAGVPVEWLPAPLVAAVGLSLYYDSRSVREYGIFVAGALMTAAWFVSHHFWFLDARVGHLRVRTACRLALAALAPALAIPGLVIAQSGRAAVGVLLFVQAELVCILEEQLYSAAALEGPGAEPMYPAYLVVITSAAGALAASRLAAARLAPRWAGWVVPALYAAKLCMLVVPEAHLVLPVGLLALAAAAPAALHEPPQGKRRCRIKPWQGLAHAGAIVSAALLARFAVLMWCSGRRWGGRTRACCSARCWWRRRSRSRRSFRGATDTTRPCSASTRALGC
ncbi:MAG: hypothetical protein J3K34DRAFT_168086 [Monoraphidium minutum]|nr:MAG: hypothetical protein J3K34DRAFT_168086 [Monoraphidium minutum]